MTYITKDFSRLLGGPHFSDTLLNAHFTLYKGYVDNANKAIALLDTVEKGSYEYAEIKRRLGWEIDGIKLHELYFANLSTEPQEMMPHTKEAIIAAYGSEEEYKASLKRNGMTRGIGWVVLVRDRDTGKIFHSWVGEHNQGNIVGADILLVMDCWEHSYIADFGISRAAYIDAFIQSIDWGVVEKRLEESTQA